jgi:hypothetical protein
VPLPDNAKGIGQGYSAGEIELEHGKITLVFNDGVGLLTLNYPGSLNAWGVKLRSDHTLGKTAFPGKRKTNFTGR